MAVFTEALYSEYVGRELKLVVPTPSVRKHLISLIPEFSTRDFICIPHGTKEMVDTKKLSRSRDSGKLRIVVLGHLAEHKGLLLFHKIFKEVLRFADIFLVGCGEDGRQYRNQNGMHVISKYDLRQLGTILRNINPDVGLLLSIWPETFSYTLSELMMLSIPVVANNLGSFSDRVVHGETGFLTEPDPRDIISMLIELNERRDLLEKVRENLLAHEQSNLVTMVEKYRKLNSGITIPASVFNIQKNGTISQTKNQTLFACESVQNGFEGMSRDIKRRLKGTDRIKPWLKPLVVIFINLWISLPRIFLRII